MDCFSIFNLSDHHNGNLSFTAQKRSLMNHWFYVGRDLAFFALAVFPIFSAQQADQHNDGFPLFLGIIIQVCWVGFAFGWFK